MWLTIYFYWTMLFLGNTRKSYTSAGKKVWRRSRILGKKHEQAIDRYKGETQIKGESR